MESYVNIKTISEKVQVSERTIRRIIRKEEQKKKQGKGKGFPCYRVGRLLRFKESEVDEYFKKKFKEGG